MNLPSPEAEPERYKGRPLLIFLENYVLDCIGELPADKQDSMQFMVQKVFGGNDDWQAMLRGELQLDARMDDVIRDMWRHNQGQARGHNLELHPVQFAKMVVDQNFAHLV